MSDQGSAHKNHASPANSGDRAFDAIYNTIAETAAGRRFLAEFARRQTAQSQLASAAATVTGSASGAAGGPLDLFLFDVADMAQAIARTKAEIASIRHDAAPQDDIGDATGELQSIVDMTESAASRILAAAERVQEIAWTLREQGAPEQLCNDLDAQATEIYTACSFQDLTGQRTRKVIQVLRYLEYRVNAMIELWSRSGGAGGGGPRVQTAPGALEQAEVDLMLQSARPVAPADAASQRLHVLLPDNTESQASASIGTKQAAPTQQDASLEDIGRVMMALDPSVPRAADQSQPSPAKWEAPNSPVFTETRPDLTVAAAVLAREANAVQSKAWSESVPSRPGPEAAANTHEPPADNASDPASAATAPSILDRLPPHLLPQRPSMAAPAEAAAGAESDGEDAEEFLFGAKPGPEAAAAAPAAAPANDPLAPLRALSDEERIALFS